MLQLNYHLLVVDEKIKLDADKQAEFFILTDALIDSYIQKH